MLKKTVLVGAGVFAIQGCTVAVLRSMDDLPQDRSRPVTAEAENWVILLNGTNNGADQQAVEQLAKSCPDAGVKVSVVENKYSFWLLSFLYRDQVTAHGYCVPK